MRSSCHLLYVRIVVLLIYVLEQDPGNRYSFLLEGLGVLRVSANPRCLPGMALRLDMRIRAAVRARGARSEEKTTFCTSSGSLRQGDRTECRAPVPRPRPTNITLGCMVEVPSCLAQDSPRTDFGALPKP